MPRGTEEVLQEKLWSWLADRGYEVAGEVGIGDGAIDLVAKDSTEYLGFELKTLYGLGSQAGLSFRKVASTVKQIQKYERCSQFDRLYFCCEDPERVRNRMMSVDESSTYQFEVSSSLLNQLGLVQVSLAPEIDIAIVEQAEKLNRTGTPDLPRNNEAWVQHHAWEWAHQDSQAATREGLLPEDYYVDISSFVGSTDTTEILENQDQYSHVGIEAKGVSGLTPRDDLRDQLQNYLDSGGLTHLYLAVPLRVHEQINPHAGQQTLVADNSSDIPQQVGIMTVDETGEVKIRREPTKVQMTYDGLRWGDLEYVPVGWGARCKREKETFNQISYWYYHKHTLN